MATCMAGSPWLWRKACADGTVGGPCELRQYWGLRLGDARSGGRVRGWGWRGQRGWGPRMERQRGAGIRRWWWWRMEEWPVDPGVISERLITLPYRETLSAPSSSPSISHLFFSEYTLSGRISTTTTIMFSIRFSPPPTIFEITTDLHTIRVSCGPLHPSGSLPNDPCTPMGTT